MISLKVDEIDLDIVPVKLDCGQKQRKKRDIYTANDEKIRYHIFKREAKAFIDDTKSIFYLRLFFFDFFYNQSLQSLK